MLFMLGQRTVCQQRLFHIKMVFSAEFRFGGPSLPASFPAAGWLLPFHSSLPALGQSDSLHYWKVMQQNIFWWFNDLNLPSHHIGVTIQRGEEGVSLIFALVLLWTWISPSSRGIQMLLWCCWGFLGFSFAIWAWVWKSPGLWVLHGSERSDAVVPCAFYFCWSNDREMLLALQIDRRKQLLKIPFLWRFSLCAGEMLGRLSAGTESVLEVNWSVWRNAVSLHSQGLSGALEGLGWNPWQFQATIVGSPLRSCLFWPGKVELGLC